MRMLSEQSVQLLRGEGGMDAAFLCAFIKHKVEIESEVEKEVYVIYIYIEREREKERENLIEQKIQ